ncbi:MAG: fliC [Myxococcaceae bacterium]|nr:fliC [Myxococcaceae bacterium]
MGLSLLTNTASLEAQRNLTSTGKALASNFAKLSSGQRINTASDDAAGLAISERMKSQISSMSQAERNANDGISLLQTADSALNQNAGVLSRMRDLAMQSSNGTLGTSDRSALQTEFGQLTSELDRISNVTEFNGSKLLDGSNKSFKFQVGISSSASDTITANMSKMTAKEYGTDDTGTAIDLTALAIGNGKGSDGVTDVTGDATSAQSALATLDKAIAATSSTRANLGATQNRLQVTVSNLESAQSNLSSANSRIRDVDVAQESASMTRNNILSQAGLAVLSQANQLPSQALSLLRG